MPAALLLAALAAASGEEPRDRPNVLLIVVDDLRPELGCYGAASAVTPHVDRFAASGVLFSAAYCQVPTCGASRASLFTGLRPERHRFRNYLARADEDAPGVPTLHGHFKRNGYRTVSLGKVLHHKTDTVDGWADPPWRPSAPMYATAAARDAQRENSAARPGKSFAYGPPTEAGGVPDDFYADGKLAAEAAARLHRLAAGNEPFFLAVGFQKPHLPFVAPQQYWDLHPVENVPDPAHPDRPDAPAAAFHKSGELRAYAGIPAKGPVDEATARRLIRGYRAAVSYADANVGRVLGALRETGLEDDTVVVVTSDHGWNLGEHGLWCKHSCFETSLRVPLIVRAPGRTPAGATADGLVELLDLYPTLCDLAGVPKPGHLAGASLAAGLADPGTLGKPAAVSRYRRGDTLRTARHRFTDYTDAKGGAAEPLGSMLYDHAADPGETTNLAPAEPAVADELLNRLNAVAGDRRVRAGLTGGG